MNNPLKIKYQDLINQQKLSSECPFATCTTSTGEGFRWIFLPIENNDNFLPSILLNQKRNIPLRRNSGDDNSKCSSCAISMFDSEVHAVEKFNNFPKHIREMLGYTHVAQGVIDGLGLKSRTNKSGHFDFFEFEDVDLLSVFIIVNDL